MSPWQLLVWLCAILAVALAASTAKDGHTHAHGNKERLKDGAGHISDNQHDTSFDHEAIVGSMKEAEEFDQLTADEAKEKLAELLKYMDRNSNNMIDHNELKQWILRSFKMLSKEESQERMDEVDVNLNGKVTWDEYIAETYGIHSADDIDLPTGEEDDERRMLQEDQTLFNAADGDKDGSLTKDEFLAFTHPEEHPTMLSIILQQTLDNKDTDNDGFLSFQEFVGEKAREKSKEWLLVEKDKFDNDYDRDSDGRLDHDEIRNWVVPSNEEIADDETTHLFASADDDNDGVLSFDEILEHHDVFVGSEATDYGDHLKDVDRFSDEL